MQNIRSVRARINPFALTRQRIDDFFGPELERKLTIWTRFSVRVYDRAWEAPFALFLSTAERRLIRVIFRTQSRSSYERVCWLDIHTDHGQRFSFSFFFVFSLLPGFVPSLSKNHTAVPRSTQTTINSTVPRHMTASTRTPLYVSRPQFKTVPYRITVETVQYIRRSALISHTNYCPFFLHALRSTLVA